MRSGMTDGYPWCGLARARRGGHREKGESGNGGVGLALSVVPTSCSGVAKPIQVDGRHLEVGADQDRLAMTAVVQLARDEPARARCKATVGL